MKINSGVTLLELLIAISLLTLVIFSASSIYLSSSNIYASASGWAKAQSNAQIPMMHIKKYSKDCASNFKIMDNGIVSDNGNAVEFRVYGNVADPQPTITRRYEFTNGEIRYRWAVGVGEVVIGKNIRNCVFRIADADGYLLGVEITAEDNNGDNPYTLTSNISAGSASIPCVFQAY